MVLYLHTSPPIIHSNSKYNGMYSIKLLVKRDRMLYINIDCRISSGVTEYSQN